MKKLERYAVSDSSCARQEVHRVQVFGGHLYVVTVFRLAEGDDCKEHAGCEQPIAVSTLYVADDA